MFRFVVWVLFLAASGQAGLVGAAVVVAAAGARLPERPALEGEPAGPWSLPAAWSTAERVWAIGAALAIFCTCLASDLIQGSRRSMFRARCVPCARGDAVRSWVFADVLDVCWKA